MVLNATTALRLLKAHVHPSGFVCLCFCFETLFLSNSVFWLGRVSTFFTLGWSMTQPTLKTATFSWTRSFLRSTRCAKLLGWTWAFNNYPILVFLGSFRQGMCISGEAWLGETRMVCPQFHGRGKYKFFISALDKISTHPLYVLLNGFFHRLC